MNIRSKIAIIMVLIISVTMFSYDALPIYALEIDENEKTVGLVEEPVLNEQNTTIDIEQVVLEPTDEEERIEETKIDEIIKAYENEDERLFNEDNNYELVYHVQDDGTICIDGFTGWSNGSLLLSLGDSFLKNKGIDHIITKMTDREEA